MYTRVLIFTFFIIGFTVLLGFLPVHGEAEIYDNVLRLHVLANSDSQEDQELKLKVRDAVLAATEDIFKDCQTKEQAQKAANENIELIQSIAADTLRSYGCDYAVSVTVSQEEYPTRNYESCCFPSGEYTSVRIMIGEAEGQNWWCVLFPPLCLDAASGKSDAFVQAGLTDSQYNVITQTSNPQYKVRFKLLEVLEDAIGKN